MNKNKINGVGLGLRFPHLNTIMGEPTDIPWFEVIADDFIDEGPHHDRLDQLRKSYPVVMHSVGLNIGGTDDFSIEHLHRMKEVYNRFEPEWISDHLCWSAHNGRFHYDLLPIPKTKEALKHVVARVHFLQDFFQRKLVLENITAYIEFTNDEFTEIQFITEIQSQTGCKLLLDVSNVLINASNRNFDPMKYLNEYPLEHVDQAHLSGGRKMGDLTVDSHSEGVGEKDVQLLKMIYKQGYSFPVCIERDSNLPDFEVLEQERQQVMRSLQ